MGWRTRSSASRRTSLSTPLGSYEDFRQVSDSEVIDILSKSRSRETTVSQT